MKKENLKIGDIKRFEIEVQKRTSFIVGVVIKGPYMESNFNSEIKTIVVLSLTGEEEKIQLQNIVYIGSKQLPSETRDFLSEIAANYKVIETKIKEKEKLNLEIESKYEIVKNLRSEMLSRTGIYPKQVFLEKVIEAIDPKIKDRMLRFNYISNDFDSQYQNKYYDVSVSLNSFKNELSFVFINRHTLIDRPSPNNCNFLYFENDGHISFDKNSIMFKKELARCNKHVERLLVEKTKTKKNLVNEYTYIGLGDKVLYFGHRIEISMQKVYSLTNSVVDRTVKLINAKLR